MAVPLIQQFRVGAYILRKKLGGQRRYPLVLMLEPLFRCNLACQGCGKIAHPDHILNQRLSVEECLEAARSCGAPIVSIPGGEPLLHKDIEDIVAGLIAQRRFVYLCTNALLLEKRLERFTPSPYLTFSVHLDGDREHHDQAVDQEGVFDRAVSAIRAARAKGFRVTVNCTVFDNADVERLSAFLDFVCHDLKVEGVTVSPGFAYEDAPEQSMFLGRERTKALFRKLFRMGKGRGWRFSQSSLFLDFLAGNQPYQCTPWGNPTRNVFGWQQPCYLIGEGHVPTFQELMENTDWEAWGTGNNPKCDNCMMHCGYEPTAVDDTVGNPLKALKVSLLGPGR
ncbi:adenosyl-hopene transferase HpnH [Roseospirillum parvum]|uniref:Hopanoid biosynthesis associated radical SAM protein HpnH n=1 Tax=Roseospirillum parvum TaxID=83401 RepID=A0A1G7XRQ0_9PROT|nr:adenosyl-hopene transferase HpnH [Roseospirillum parvum]SDG86869.1 hopanoid biosynthesis associated radical SAM protein HpnH [Roseospirillum parvum]